MLKLVEAWIKWTGFGSHLTANSDALARAVRACRRDMQLARRQTRRNQEEGIPDEIPLLFSGRPISDASTLVGEDENKRIFELADNMSDEDKGDDSVEDIINHYADSIRSSAQLLRRPARDDDIHPAYRRSTMPFRRRPLDAPRPPTPRPAPAPSMSTSYASITTIRPRISVESLERFDDLSPRPERPQNRSTYMDSMANARMSRVSAEVPPLRPRQQPAYTESAYSRDIFGRRAADARSFGTGGATVNNTGIDAEVQARAYADLVRRQEEESVMEGNPQNMFANDEEIDVPPIPRRSEYRATVWSGFAGHRVPRRSRQDGW